ncbi:MAG: ATP-binding cassette domain-containing protein, partial [Alphaproteobacteria bacterium]
TFAQLVSSLTTIAVIVYGVYLIGDGVMTLGALVAATILTSRAMAPLGVVVALLTRVQQSRVALKSLDALMKAPVERPADKSFVHRPRLSGQIAFRNVEFTYPGGAVQALNGASFEIAAGEKVAIIGRIGSGKSTVARLLVGLYAPQSGTVMLDGSDARQIDPADVRRNIGYVSQDNQLFFGSVRENVALGAPHADDQAIERALTIAGAADFVKTHPHGLDMQVGERGASLSGGQRQAITVARAVLTDPPVLVLDEPSSQMDRGTEIRLVEHLGRIMAGKTLIVMTHRGSMLDLVQRLIVIDGGRVVADGPKQQVLEALKAGKLRSPLA